MRAFLLIIAMAFASAAHAAPGEEAKQVTPDGLNGLQQLVQRIQKGALGDDIADASFTFSFQGLGSDGAVRLDLIGRDGSRTGLFLLRPPKDWQGVPPRQFILFPDSNLGTARQARLVPLLDEVFPANPWATFINLDAPVNRYVPHPTGRWRVWIGFLFLLGSVLAGVRYLLMSRPSDASATSSR